MRLVVVDKNARAYISPYELDQYKQFAPKRVRLAARIMGRTSPRIGKTAKLRRSDFFVPESDNIVIPFVDLRDTKDTRDVDVNAEVKEMIGGRHRYSWCPRDLFDEVHNYCERDGIGPDEQIFDVQKKRLGDLVSNTADALADESGDPCWQAVTSHTFRVFFATNGYYRIGIGKKFLMEMGSWKSEEAMDPYFEHPLPVDIQNHLAERGIIDADPGVDRDDPPDYDVETQLSFDDFDS